MKKTYQNPTTILIKVHTAQMMAASDPDGFNGALGSTKVSGSAGLARGNGGDLWDDEEE